MSKITRFFDDGTPSTATDVKHYLTVPDEFYDLESTPTTGVPEESFLKSEEYAFSENTPPNNPYHGRFATVDLTPLTAKTPAGYYTMIDPEPYYKHEIEKPKKPTGCYIPHRVIICTFLMFSNIICYVDRVNMAVAIIPMAKEFNWSERTQGSILSSFYWGYLFTQILGGILSKQFGGKVVLYTGVCLWSCLTLLTPIFADLATKYWLGILIFARVGLGIGEGVNFPAVTQMFSVWVPKSERSRSWSIIGAGTDIGTLIALLLGPVITVYIGWQWTFYIFGFVGLIWAGLFLFLASSLPSESSFCKPYEKFYIEQSIKEENDSTESDTTDANVGAFRFMWNVLRSGAMWAAVLAPVCFSYGSYLLGTYMPKYMLSLGVSFAHSGYYSSLPYFFISICAPIWGFISDSTILRYDVNVQNMRKIMTVISMVGAPFFWFFLRFTRFSIVLSTCLLCVSSSLSAAHRAGSSMSTVDIGGPKYASILYSVSNTFQTIPGIVGPLVTGWILDEIPLIESTIISFSPWDVVFNIMIIINFVGAIIFVALGKGVPQYK
ncbi:12 TM domain-containing transmembrane protein [Acrasis kona]|uniref:12 TM domain-containing transmembrane protein n=1 Tax=Acrasis kona TaxID=1008807 RepID=A0AAW2YKU4_9EUKA